MINELFADLLKSATENIHFQNIGNAGRTLLQKLANTVLILKCIFLRLKVSPWMKGSLRIDYRERILSGSELTVRSELVCGPTRGRVQGNGALQTAENVTPELIA